MKSKDQNKISIIVVGRDKFSPTEKCLKSVMANTSQPYELICVLGAAPQSFREHLEEVFKKDVHFIWEDEFISPPRGRNIGLRACSEELAVVMDNDIQVRPDWLKHLLDCQKETDAVMVAPLTLEDQARVHTGANYFYVTKKNGKNYGFKELMYHGKIVGETHTLKRLDVDYGELHCQLVKVKPSLELNAYDENILEVCECDNGLTYQKAGLRMVFEPKAVVNYMLSHPIEPMDIPYFIWRWDMRGVLKGYQYFEKKWGIDITEYGKFAFFLLKFQNKVGFFARTFQSHWGIKMDRFFQSISGFFKKVSGKLASPWNRFWKKKLGYYDWVKYFPEE